jgi:hypothetical protein
MSLLCVCTKGRGLRSASGDRNSGEIHEHRMTNNFTARAVVSVHYSVANIEIKDDKVLFYLCFMREG